jgi:hypothetical protein
VPAAIPDATQVDRLAARLGRPPAELAAFVRLTPEQVALLGDAIDAACARQRHVVDEAFARVLPPPPRRLLARMLRGAGR